MADGVFGQISPCVFVRCLGTIRGLLRGRKNMRMAPVWCEDGKVERAISLPPTSGVCLSGHLFEHCSPNES